MLSLCVFCQIPSGLISPQPEHRIIRNGKNKSCLSIFNIIKSWICKNEKYIGTKIESEHFLMNAKEHLIQHKYFFVKKTVIFMVEKYTRLIHFR